MCDKIYLIRKYFPTLIGGDPVKKVIALFLTALVLLGLTACGRSFPQELEQYATPWKVDAVKQAKETAAIHYYFMSAQGMVADPTHSNYPEKWGDSWWYSRTERPCSSIPALLQWWIRCGMSLKMWARCFSMTGILATFMYPPTEAEWSTRSAANRKICPLAIFAKGLRL